MTATDGKAAGDRYPGAAHAGAVPDEIVGTLEAELDREGGDQRTGGEGEHAGQHLLGERKIKSEDRAQHDRTRRDEAEQPNRHDFGEREATRRHKDLRKTSQRASPAMEILIEAGAQSHGENDDSGKAQDRPGHPTDPGEPFDRRSFGDMNATGGHRDLLSSLAALSAGWPDGMQPK